MIDHVPLKFRKVHTPPGAEHGIFPAPFKKVLHHIHKRFSVPLQFFDRHMGHFRDDPMHLPVHARTDDPVKLSGLFPLFIQFYCSDFKDLKRKPFHGQFFSARVLVPFQVKYNKIFHNKRV